MELTRSAGPHTAPAMMSLEPQMNFDILCTTTSAPRRAGDNDRGANVLSTTTVSPLSCPIPVGVKEDLHSQTTHCLKYDDDDDHQHDGIKEKQS
jgi:hypothetical protein